MCIHLHLQPQLQPQLHFYPRFRLLLSPSFEFLFCNNDSCRRRYRRRHRRCSNIRKCMKCFCMTRCNGLDRLAPPNLNRLILHANCVAFSIDCIAGGWAWWRRLDCICSRFSLWPTFQCYSTNGNRQSKNASHFSTRWRDATRCCIVIMKFTKLKLNASLYSRRCCRYR